MKNIKLLAGGVAQGNNSVTVRDIGNKSAAIFFMVYFA